MKKSEDLSDVVETLQQALKHLDELELRVAALKVAEAIEILSPAESQAD
ncbi:MAG: hypothetical protein ABJN65_08130 [Parasphingorhabdus sp.]